MIVKLVYQDWIHRVTDIPSHFSDLRGIIISSFKTELPEGFTLSYTIPGQVENAPLVTEEDYQALLALEPSTKSVKIIVGGERKPSGDYDVIAQTKPGNYQAEERKVERDLEGFVQDVSESLIIPQVSQVQQKYPYISGAQDQNDENIRKIVREVLKETLPTIVSQVKDAVLKELRPLMPVYHEPAQPPKVQQQQQQQKPQRPQIYEVEEKIDINPMPGEVIFERSEDVYGREENNGPKAQEGGQNDLLDKMKKFGNSLKDQLAVLPGKAKDAFDDLSQKLEGDPYITCEEGKYPKSVVDKANLLREIFPEEDKKVLLEFVKRYPRHATLEQLANLYLVKDEPQQAAGGEGQNNNA